ncbi:hypothetical protein, partial [Escherichia coli]|uniref:hypothetical protein n=1 Tax=Escherichia coli TaxID=562 RepID=UPI003B75E2D1
FQSPLSIFSFVNGFISDLDLTKPSEKQGRAVAAPVPRWYAPPIGVAKVNVDASISKNSGVADVATVACDDAGGFLVASMMTFQGLTDPQ